MGATAALEPPLRVRSPHAETRAANAPHHFHNAQRVSCFVVNACSPGMVATTL